MTRQVFDHSDVFLEETVNAHLQEMTNRGFKLEHVTETAVPGQARFSFFWMLLEL